MKQFWEDMPYGPLAEALRSTVGRCLSMAIVCVLGLGVGYMIAELSFSAFLDGIISCPAIIFSSIFYSYGLLIWPLIFLLSWLYTRFQLPLWVMALPFLGTVWLAYDIDNYFIKHDPMHIHEFSKSQHT